MRPARYFSIIQLSNSRALSENPRDSIGALFYATDNFSKGMVAVDRFCMYNKGG